MMEHMFIYVQDASAKEQLLKAGLKMLKADERNAIYVFAMPDAGINLEFAASGISYMLSNTLTF